MEFNVIAWLQFALFPTTLYIFIAGVGIHFTLKAIGFFFEELREDQNSFLSKLSRLNESFKLWIPAFIILLLVKSFAWTPKFDENSRSDRGSMYNTETPSAMKEVEKKDLYTNGERIGQGLKSSLDK